MLTTRGAEASRIEKYVIEPPENNGKTHQNNSKTQMSESSRPAFRVYSIIPRQDNGEDWLSIGSAIPHQDGQGFDVILQALPLNSKLVMRDCTQGAQQTPNRRERDKYREPGRLGSLKQQVDAFERALIEHCLLEARGKISAVIEQLGIPRRTLSEKMARLGIDRRRLINGAGTNASAKRSSLDAVASDGRRRGTATANRSCISRQLADHR